MFQEELFMAETGTVSPERCYQIPCQWDDILPSQYGRLVNDVATAGSRFLRRRSRGRGARELNHADRFYVDAGTT